MIVDPDDGDLREFSGLVLKTAVRSLDVLYAAGESQVRAKHGKAAPLPPPSATASKPVGEEEEEEAKSGAMEPAKKKQKKK